LPRVPLAAVLLLPKAYKELDEVPDHVHHD
jgi:hypothetical protein